MKQKSAGQAYGSVFKFNDISGNLNKPNYDSIALQLDLIQEEYLETVDAFDLDDKVEILDGACDMFVVVCGLLQKLEAQGYDVEEALFRVCDNNMNKFPTTDGNKTSTWNPAYTAHFNKKYKVLVLKDQNGKIRKPDGFVPVDLSDLVPKEGV